MITPYIALQASAQRWHQLQQALSEDTRCFLALLEITSFKHAVKETGSRSFACIIELHNNGITNLSSYSNPIDSEGKHKPTFKWVN